MTGGSNVTSIALTKYWTPRSSKGSSGGGPDVRLFRGNGGVGLVVGAVADVDSARPRSCSLSGVLSRGRLLPAAVLRRAASFYSAARRWL